jgi:hypothetical protein
MTTFASSRLNNAREDSAHGSFSESSPEDPIRWTTAMAVNASRRHRVPIPPYSVDWRRVTRVSQTTEQFQGVNDTAANAVQVVGGVGSSGVLVLAFRDANMAARAAYAMEVLRVTCDRTNATGF